MNPYISVTTLGRLRVPILPIEVQKQIEATVASRLALLEESVSQFQQAMSELLMRLNWDELQSHETELTYIRQYGDMANAGRADAEFFQPQHARLREALVEQGALPIAAFCGELARGVQPILIPGGQALVIDSKSVREYGVYPFSDRTEISVSGLKGRVKFGDVLLNSTGRGTSWSGLMLHAR